MFLSVVVRVRIGPGVGGGGVVLEERSGESERVWTTRSDDRTLDLKP